MKPIVLRPQAREDRRREVRHYRQESGAQVAAKLVDALRKALLILQGQPSIGSPTLGLEIDEHVHVHARCLRRCSACRRR